MRTVITKLAAVAVLSFSLAACQTAGTGASLTPITKVDTAIASVNAKVYKYCVFLVTASAVAKIVIKNQPLASKIDAGVNEYCTNAANVVDVPTALSELGAIYISAVNAGVKPNQL
jgi:hypothetical protein